MNIPCRVSVEELSHDLQQYGAEDHNKRIGELATEAAAELITDADQLWEMILDNELVIKHQLARAIKELGNATNGDPIATQAVLNAVAQMEKIVLPKAVEICRDEAERQVSNEVNQ